MSWILWIAFALQAVGTLMLFIYFLRTESWKSHEFSDEHVEPESDWDADDPDVVPNPYREVWKEYLATRER